MAAHERALALSVETRQRLTIGISDHVAGPELPALIARMNAQDPELLIEIRIGSSGDLLQSYDRRELDTVIARLHAGRDDGTVLAEEQLGWFAAPHWQHRADEPLPLATLAEPCGVRALAAKRLDESAVPWREVFVGGGVAAVAAAVMAGLGVAALAPRMLPFGAVDVGPRLRLPRCRACRCCCTRAPGAAAPSRRSPRCRRRSRARYAADTPAPRPCAIPFAAAVLAPARFTLTVSSQHTTKVHP